MRNAVAFSLFSRTGFDFIEQFLADRTLPEGFVQVDVCPVLVPAVHRQLHPGVGEHRPTRFLILRSVWTWRNAVSTDRSASSAMTDTPGHARGDLLHM